MKVKNSMIDKAVNIEKVLLFHDVDVNYRTGMQDQNSRYLMNWDKFKNIIKSAEKSETIFEKIEPYSALPQNFTRITVDDGGGSSLELAKFLKSLNIKAYFFIVSNFIGRDKFLTKNEIHDIHKMGHIIGSHSHTHPNPFHLISKNEVIKELNKSIAILEDIINSPVRTFAVPGGEVNKKLLNFLSSSVFDLDEIYISTPYKGKALGYADSSKIYGRLCLEGTMSDSKLFRFIEGKGWNYALMDYQLRRLRREIIYKLGFKI